MDFMNEAAAWEFLGNLWANKTESNDDGEFFVTIDTYGCYGLCPCVYDLKFVGLINEETEKMMKKRILGLPDDPKHPNFKFPLTKEGSILRSKFCYGAADESFKEMVKEVTF